jgi:hypothetical protein
VLVYPAGMSVSTRALRFVTDALRAHRETTRTGWRVLSSGGQALLVLAHLRKGETYRDLAVGFGVGTTSAYRYLPEALQVLASLASCSCDAARERRRRLRLPERGALRGAMGQAASDGIDGDAFVRSVGAAGPVELRHPCAA